VRVLSVYEPVGRGPRGRKIHDAQGRVLRLLRRPRPDARLPPRRRPPRPPLPRRPPHRPPHRPPRRLHCGARRTERRRHAGCAGGSGRGARGGRVRWLQGLVVAEADPRSNAHAPAPAANPHRAPPVAPLSCAAPSAQRAPPLAPAPRARAAVSPMICFCCGSAGRLLGGIGGGGSGGRVQHSAILRAARQAARDATGCTDQCGRSAHESALARALRRAASGERQNSCRGRPWRGHTGRTGLARARERKRRRRRGGARMMCASQPEDQLSTSPRALLPSTIIIINSISHAAHHLLRLRGVAPQGALGSSPMPPPAC
jgi:hypothetical protein